MIRSLSGPSGKVAGSTFVFDETRTRFVFPQDRSLIVLFEWETSPGLHVLTGMWKQPDGRVAQISPDVKVETQTKSISCYWTFNLVQGMENGVWTLEVRMDGAPAGSHPFEVAGMEEHSEIQAVNPAPQRTPTLDEIFKAVSPSLVWIHKLDPSGRSIDTSSGFILEPNRIATAFQAIDSAAKIEIEFANGRKATADVLTGWSRTGDWAIVKADTSGVPAIPRGDPKSVAVGERLIVFNFEANARLIGGVDIGGWRSLAGFGERIQISPPVPFEAAGGPLLDVNGHVVGILGGSLYPGARIAGRAASLSPGLWNSVSAENAATPISELSENPGGAKTLDRLLADGTLTPSIAPMPEFMYGGTVSELPKRASDPLSRDVSDFSRKDAQVVLYSMWQRKAKLSKGEVSLNVYDPLNRLRTQVNPRKVTINEIPMRIAFTFSPAGLPTGVYRLDLCWDGRPAWRTFIRITD